jgi:hypothetical protein
MSDMTKGYDRAPIEALGFGGREAAEGARI